MANKMNDILLRPIFNENPIALQILGICSALAVTSSLKVTAVMCISLTVVDVRETSFTCHLIPHTLDETVLPLKEVGHKVNLEFDMIGKYLYRFHQLSSQS